MSIKTTTAPATEDETKTTTEAQLSLGCESEPDASQLNENEISVWIGTVPETDIDNSILDDQRSYCEHRNCWR